MRLSQEQLKNRIATLNATFEEQVRTEMFKMRINWLFLAQDLLLTDMPDDQEAYVQGQLDALRDEFLKIQKEALRVFFGKVKEITATPEDAEKKLKLPF